MVRLIATVSTLLITGVIEIGSVYPSPFLFGFQYFDSRISTDFRASAVIDYKLDESSDIDCRPTRHRDSTFGRYSRTRGFCPFRCAVHKFADEILVIKEPQPLCCLKPFSLVIELTSLLKDPHSISRNLPRIFDAGKQAGHGPQIGALDWNVLCGI